MEFEINDMKKSYVKQLLKRDKKEEFTQKELEFIAEDTRSTVEEIKNIINELK
jgi:signal transduction histidine kinase